MSARLESRTLGDLLDEMAAARPHAQALVFRHEQWSYAALHARVDKLAGALLAVGVARGDRVAVLLPNCPEWVVAALAIAKIGGIVSAISTFSTPRAGWMLEHSEAVALIPSPPSRAGLSGHAPELFPIFGERARSARSERLPTCGPVSIRRSVDGVFSGRFLALGPAWDLGAAGEHDR